MSFDDGSTATLRPEYELLVVQPTTLPLMGIGGTVRSPALHTPATQVLFCGQALPHTPQLLASVCRLEQ